MTYGARILAAAVVFCALSGPASAQMSGQSADNLTAGLLYRACNASGAPDSHLRDMAAQTCAMYFRGLTDGLWLMQTIRDSKDTAAAEAYAGCLPGGSPIPTSEAIREFQLFLKEHPQAAGNSAALVATMGIMRAHPCR